MDGTGSSGYLIGTRTPSTADVLKPCSVAADAGVTIVEGLREDVAMPRVTAAGSGGWVAPGDTLPDAQPTLGSASATPKMGGAIIKLSHQFMRCGDEAEAFIRAHLLRAAGTLLDKAFFSGAGGKEPLGLYNLPAGPFQQSGSTLARAGLLAMRKAVVAAGARESALRWVGTEGTQETLAGRHSVANTHSPLWGDDGRILNAPAFATPTAAHVASGTSYAALTLGDFSQANVMFWGPASLQVAVDPYNAFETGGIAVRVLLLADVVFPQPAAFAVAKQVT
jgi:HK97 family phage major capsid protein